MKFARYLQDTQTPEWTKAYIDYRGLKVQLSIIRAKSSRKLDASSFLKSSNVDKIHNFVPEDGKEEYIHSKVLCSDQADRLPRKITWVSDADPARNAAMDTGVHRPLSSTKWMSEQDKRISSTHRLTWSILPSRATKTGSDVPSQETFVAPSARPSILASPHSRDSDFTYFASSPFHTILSNLPAIHAKFFGMLDAELDKVGTFYAEREKEMRAHDKLLRKQLKELGVHRELFYKSSAHRRTQSWIKRARLSAAPALSSLIQWFQHSNAKSKKHRQTGVKSIDPQGYRRAKRRLREAVAEHYRGLELLNKYRTLNLAGFRKALEKYVKITSIPILDAYMEQKVEPSTFASGAMVGTMLKEIERLFATRFEHEDRKKAKKCLRFEPLSKKHYSNTYRSGLWLGLALPAIAGGSYLSFQEPTRVSLPSWNILLFIYSVFFVPVLLALLIGINIFVWARTRISYVFIFELNPKSGLHHHEYLELPSFFLCTLAYAFWFSLAQIGPSMLWPLIWLALILIVMFTPILNFMWGRARWWTIRSIAKLGISGALEVRFADVWLGDQFCSLVYSLSNLYFVGCFYARFAIGASGHDTQGAWATCSVAQNWRWYYLLTMLPFMARFVQCLRRYRDSSLPLQLVNAGKYMMAMVYYFTYYYWRHQGSPRAGEIYIFWCFAATINSIYGCAWDFLMDWTLCQPHARYPLLRPELVYESKVPYYYFALVSNLCIRFVWLTNIFLGGVYADLWTFIAALLEILRRVQWNFYRLENQHLRNVEMYQVMREIPLPYGSDVHTNDARRVSHISYNSVNF